MIILDYILSLFYGIYFFILLILFHPIQWVAFNLFGENAHRKTVTILNFFLLYGLIIMGTRVQFTQKHKIPKNSALIIIVNHQSLYDIIGIIWFMRKFNPTFVSKKSLAKGIPSISYNLRKSGAALLDRKNRAYALEQISILAMRIQDKKTSAVIFPEGTRSRKGLKRFSLPGVATLLDHAPDALVVPLIINGTGHMDAYNTYPIRSFQKLNWTSLKPIKTKNKTAKKILEEAREQIAAYL